MTIYNIKALDARRLTNPRIPHVSTSFMLVDFKDLPEGLPSEVNLRTAEDLNKTLRKNSPYEQLTESVKQQGDWVKDYFHLRNKGIQIIADSLTPVDGGEKHEYELSIDEDRRGILDGLHTYHQILENRQKDDGSYVRESVLVVVTTGFKLDNSDHEEIIHQIARGQNTTVQVQEQSIAKHRGLFKFIEDAIKDKPYQNIVKYSENEQNKGIDIRDIIAIMNCFDLETYPLKHTEAAQPTISATGRQSILRRFISAATEQSKGEGLSEFAAMEKILPDILRLRDLIRKEAAQVHVHGLDGRATIGYLKGSDSPKIDFPFLSPGDANKYSQEFQKGLSVKKFKNDDKLESGTIFSKYEVLKGVLFPLLASFRCMLIKDSDGYYNWDRDFEEVIQIWRKVSKSLMVNVRDRGSEVQNSPDAIAKSKSIWILLLMQVAVASGTIQKFEI